MCTVRETDPVRGGVENGGIRSINEDQKKI